MFLVLQSVAKVVVKKYDIIREYKVFYMSCSSK